MEITVEIKTKVQGDCRPGEIIEFLNGEKQVITGRVRDVYPHGVILEETQDGSIVIGAYNYKVLEAYQARYVSNVVPVPISLIPAFDKGNKQ